jgi:uncharacterized protein (DUF924 family)
MLDSGIDPEEVLRFWFGEGDRDDPGQAGERMKVWFGHSPEIDADIRERFGDAVGAAAAGELEHWAATPRGRLALIILLDQLSRNAYRGTAQMYAGDERALGHACTAIDAGEDAQLAFNERLFLYLPLEHAEDLEMQERCVQLFGRMLEHAPASHAGTAKLYVDYAVRHRDIVARFGRFPHRNAILGRTSTPEEIAFLEQPGSSF